MVPTHTTKPTEIAANEVLIRIKAIALNPVDCKMIDHGMRVASWPFVPGLDGAGIVEAVGVEVKTFVSGDNVLAMFGLGGRGGSYQEYALVSEKMVAKIPPSWSLEDAATLAYVYPLTHVS